VSLSAAFAAAARDDAVTMDGVLAAMRHELRKLGRLIDESSFSGSRTPPVKKQPGRARR